MCGIGGAVWRKKDSFLPFARIVSKTLSHRGPDDEGYLLFQDNKAIPLKSFKQAEKSPVPGNGIQTHLLHRRLSILDLSDAGHQPMEYDNGRLWIVFNGEIYNYLELREELKGKGYEFKSNTDTEVILASYMEWGKECVSRFNGMWAFVILDTRKNILFGSRDRFGVKPFYYYLSKDAFIFASEIKALMGLPFIEKRINPRAVFHYLMFGLEEGEEEGFVKGIYELMPSCSFEYDIDSNELKIWRYYRLKFNPDYRPFYPEKFRTYVEMVKEKIFDAVRLRLRADVPIGSCLSGGIDSSSIVCVINELLKKGGYPQASEKKLFTASYDIKRIDIDESRWAELVVRRTNGRWYKVFPDKNSLMEELEDVVYAQDIPFGSLSIYAQYCVMKRVKKEGIKVIMDGQGGDELFTGYISYYWTYIKELINHDPVMAAKELLFLKNSPFTLKEILYAARGIIKKGSPYGQRYNLMSRYINKELQKTYRHEEHASSKVTAQDTSSLNHMLFKFMTGPRLKSLLRYEDRNSMRFSIEARTPFSDDIDLIEFVFMIPSTYKIRNGFSKRLLRSAMKGIVPDPILTRRDKIGFTAPEYAWLKKLKPVLLDYLDDGDLKHLFEVDRLKKEWELFLNLQPGVGITGLWRFVNLAIWKNVFSVGL